MAMIDICLSTFRIFDIVEKCGVNNESSAHKTSNPHAAKKTRDRLTAKDKFEIALSVCLPPFAIFDFIAEFTSERRIR